MRSLRGSRGALVALVAGAAIGLVLALVAPTSYRSEVTMLVAKGTSLPRSSEQALQAARTVSALAETDTVARLVQQGLRLDESPAALRREISARPKGGSGLVAIRVRQRTAAQAVRAAQQVGLVVSQLVSTRLTALGLQASIWDAATTATEVRPSVPASLVLGGLGGLIVWAVARLFTRRRRPEPVTRAAAPVATTPLAPVSGRYTLAGLEAAAAGAAVSRARTAQLDAYLAALRAREDEDGLLPAFLTPLVDEVFGDLVAAGRD